MSTDDEALLLNVNAAFDDGYAQGWAAAVRHIGRSLDAALPAAVEAAVDAAVARVRSDAKRPAPQRVRVR